LLIGGWTIAAELQPGSFDSAVQSISALAALGAADRWVMTSALVVVGLCHLVTAWALRPAATPGRVLIAACGVGDILVAANPLPVEGNSTPHALAATLAFVAMAAWPAVGWRRAPDTPRVLRPMTSVAAAAVLLGLVAWFAVELAARGDRIGLAERAAAAAQTIWPFAVALSCRKTG
jgi:hypothetical membrane protein